jgi:hypothetical protein
MNIARLKAELLKNKTKTAVLGGLVVVLGIFGVKAYFEVSPNSAGASVSITESPTHSSSATSLKSGEIDQKMAQAEELWKIMRTKRGIAPAKAFVLNAEANNYTRTYVPQPIPAATTENEPVKLATIPQGPTAEQLEKMKIDAVSAEAKQLVLQAVLNGDNPTALINQKRLGVGDLISGFKVIAIEDRKVRAVKDGVEVVIPLKDAAFQRGQ